MSQPERQIEPLDVAPQWPHEYHIPQMPGPPPGPPYYNPAPYAPPPAPVPARPSQRWAILGVITLTVVGMFVELQPVSLLTGPGTLYTGLAIVLVAAILSISLRLPKWLTVIVLILVGICLVNTVLTVQELDDRRRQLNDLFTP
jgi:hypothetical protein